MNANNSPSNANSNIGFGNCYVKYTAVLPPSNKNQ